MRGNFTKQDGQCAEDPSFTTTSKIFSPIKSSGGTNSKPYYYYVCLTEGLMCAIYLIKLNNLRTSFRITKFIKMEEK
jgi:hypothetical protein